MAEYSVYIQYDSEDRIFVASIPELSGCMAHGETREEAIKELEVAKELWVKTAQEDGLPIPKPNLFNDIIV